MTLATAYWTCGDGTGVLREETVPGPGPDEVLVRTLWSGVSRGTESLVHRGAVPEGERERMRAPYQEGSFPGPVKYGYLNVGVVEAGPSELVGRTVFCLFPHQSAYVVPADAVDLVPDGVPARRALLTGPLETAVNALWDVPPMLGDRVAVVGAGLVGCCLARLLGGLTGVDVTLVDVDPSKAAVAAALGVPFALAGDAPREQHVVLHASGHPDGFAQSLALLGDEGVLVELSWYGDQVVPAPLGGSFHSRRLSIRGSQVGRVSPHARAGWTPGRRRRLALDLLRDDAYDALLTGTSPLAELPTVMTRIASGQLPGILHTIDHARTRESDDPCSP